MIVFLLVQFPTFIFNILLFFFPDHHKTEIDIKGNNNLYPVPQIFFDFFWPISLVCLDIETKGKVFWK